MMISRPHDDGAHSEIGKPSRQRVMKRPKLKGKIFAGSRAVMEHLLGDAEPEHNSPHP